MQTLVKRTSEFKLNVKYKQAGNLFVCIFRHVLDGSLTDNGKWETR